MNSRSAYIAVTLLLLTLSGCAEGEPDLAHGGKLPEEVTAAFPGPASHQEIGWAGPTRTEEPLLERRGPLYPETTFMTASDLHHLSPDLWDEGSAFRRFWTTNDGKALKQGKALLDALVATATDLGPQFLVVTGDLTTNGAVASHREVAAAFAAIEEAGVPVFAIPGNHDVANPWASSFLGSREERVPALDEAGFSSLYEDFGYGEAIERHEGDLSYLAEPEPGLQLLMLDTNKYELNQERGYPVTSGAFSLKQRRWILSVLERASAEGKAVLTFSHHSFISHGAEGSYKDLYRIIDEWPRNTREFWDRSAPVMFTGHIHAQNVSAIRGREGEWIYDVATGAWSIYPHSFRFLRITDGHHLQIEGHRLTPAAFGGDGASILRRTKETYLERFVYRAGGNISEEFALPIREARLLAGYPALLSLNHMAGEEQPAPESPFLTETRRRWEALSPERLDEFHHYMLRDPAPRDNDIEIDLSTGRWRSLRQ